MDAFSSEFAHHWLAGQGTTRDDAAVELCAEESPSPSQQAALDALADRISAARSIY
jgi:hypothetical protein